MSTPPVQQYYLKLAESGILTPPEEPDLEREHQPLKGWDAGLWTVHSMADPFVLWQRTLTARETPTPEDEVR